MKLTTEQLRIAMDRILEHIDAMGASEITVDKEYYWDVPADERYDPYARPRELTVGQISEDWAHVLAMAAGKEEPLGYSLVWLAKVLRVIGEFSIG